MRDRIVTRGTQVGHAVGYGVTGLGMIIPVVFLLVPLTWGTGQPLESETYAVVTYLLGDRSYAGGTFYVCSLLVFISIGLMAAIRHRRPRIVATIAGLAAMHTLGGHWSFDAVTYPTTDRLGLVVGGLLSLVVVSLQPGRASSRTTPNRDTLHQMGNSRWLTVGLFTGGTVVAACLVTALVAATGVPYPFGQPPLDGTTGLEYLFGMGTDPSSFHLTLGMFAVAVLVTSLLRTRPWPWPQLAAIVTVPSIVPSLMYNDPRVHAIAAGATLFCLAVTALTVHDHAS